MTKKTIFIAIFLYLTLIFGFFLNEDLNGGAKPDFDFYVSLLDAFKNNFKESFLNYTELGERHSPLIIIIFSQLVKININIDLIRMLNLHINLLSIYFFYQCLKIKFYNVEKNYLIYLCFIFFLSTTFRSLSIWPDSRIIGLLFFILSVKYFLKFENNKKLKSILTNIFYLSISAYFSPNFAVFSIYFFLKAVFIFKDVNKIFYIILLNILLSLPAFYYIFILDVNFINLGLTPGTNKVLDLNSVELNISNKIICITSIIFFYTLPVLNNTNLQKKKDYRFYLKILIFIFIYIYCVYNFNYQTFFTGGGIFFYLSNFLFKNNILLYLVTLFAFFMIFIKNYNFNNILIIILLFISNPQLTIYHKYYDPLILVLMFTLFNFNLKKKFFNMSNILFIYFIYIFFIAARVSKNFLL